MKTEILSPNAPKPIGPYSQAIKVENFIFLSGQIAIDPSSGNIKSNTIEEQTKQIFKNIKEILSQCGYELNNIIKTTIFLKNIDDFPKMNRVYESFFNPPYPARTTVEVSRLPKDALIEIEAVAYREG